jgi:hypothetical protein
MALTGALTMALALAASANGERLLLCRPRILGDAALARGEAVPDAARGLSGRFLDYGVACEDAAEGSRAARRAGLRHAITSTAEGRTEGSRYVLTLADAEAEKGVAQRTVDVAPGAEGGRPVREALAQLLQALPPEPGPDRAHVAAWAVAGGGAAVAATGVLFALAARSAADARDDAGVRGDYRTYVEKDASWRRWRTASGIALGVGATALAAGLTWRFAF